MVTKGPMTLSINNYWGWAVKDIIPSAFQISTSLNLLASTNNLTITLPPFTTFVVTVTDEIGNPISNAAVFPQGGIGFQYINVCPEIPIVNGGSKDCFTQFVSRNDQGAGVTANTDGVAHISFFNSPETTQQLKLQSNSQYDRARAAVISISVSNLMSDNIIPVSIILPSYISVSGKVKSYSGKPASGLVMLYSNPFADHTASFTTDANGEFLFNSINCIFELKMNKVCFFFLFKGIKNFNFNSNSPTDITIHLHS